MKSSSRRVVGLSAAALAVAGVIATVVWTSSATPTVVAEPAATTAALPSATRPTATPPATASATPSPAPTWSWDVLCFDGAYRGEKANALVRSWDGADATMACDRWHFWPYGLNYSREYTERNLDRNVLVVQGMHEDGVRFD